VRKSALARKLFKKSNPPKVAASHRSGYLFHGDALEFLKTLGDSVADIVFLDPPFNLGKDYGSHKASDNADPEQYHAFLQDVIRESSRVLRSGGALFLYHLPFWASRVAPALHDRLEFRHWIAVSMKNGFVRGKRLYPAHYALLYFTKGDPATFKRPRLAPQRCRHCDEMVKDYGGYTPIIKRKGINLSDFWDDVSPVRHPINKNRGANELPIAITERVVKIAGRKHGVLIDPFVGSGVSLVSALRAGMHFAGNDLVRRNLTVCVERLKNENGAAKNGRKVRKKSKH
jgi:site-specific DNA-methyltransferase (adenine-specific)